MSIWNNSFLVVLTFVFIFQSSLSQARQKAQDTDFVTGLRPHSRISNRTPGLYADAFATQRTGQRVMGRQEPIKTDQSRANNTFATEKQSLSHKSVIPSFSRFGAMANPLKKKPANGESIGPLWGLSISGSRLTRNDMTIDSEENIIWVGSYEGTEDIDLGQTYDLTNSGGADIFIIKYDKQGNTLWAKSIGEQYSSDNVAKSVTLDENNNLIIVGKMGSDRLDFGNNVILTKGSRIDGGYGVGDFFMVKYSSGGVAQWAKKFSTDNGRIDISSVEYVNSSIYLTGIFTGPEFDLGNDVILESDYPRDFSAFVAKMDDQGIAVWGNSAQGEGNVRAYDAKISETGKVSVLGLFSSSSLEIGNMLIQNKGHQDIFLANYDSNGSLLWAGSYGGSGFDEPRSLVLDENGNIIFTAYFYSTLFSAGPEHSALNQGSGDIVLCKVGESGTTQWLKSYGSAGTEFSQNVETGLDGDIFLFGSFRGGSFVLGETTLTNTPGSAANKGDVFLSKLNSQGEVIWAKSFGGSDSEFAYGKVYKSNIYLEGSSLSESMDMGFDVTIESPNLFLVKYGLGDFDSMDEIPDLDLSTDQLIFSDTKLGGSKVLTFTMENVGGAPLEIASINLKTETANEQFDWTQFNGLIQPDEKQEISVTFTPSSPGEKSVTLEIISNSEKGPHIIELIGQVREPRLSITNEFRTVELINGGGALPFSPSSVLIGEKSTLELFMHYSGFDDLDIYFVPDQEFWDNGFNFENGGDIGIVPGMGTQDVIFSFSPTSRGIKNGKVKIHADSDDELLFEFTLSAEGKSLYNPILSLSALEVDFGAVDVGSTKKLPLIIRNLGNSPLDVLSMEFKEEPLSAEFSFTGYDGLIQPGESEQLEITFAPSSLGHKEIILEIKSNDEKVTHQVLLNNSGNDLASEISMSNKFGTLEYILTSTQHLHFEPILINQNSDFALHLKNGGKEELRIDYELIPLTEDPFRIDNLANVQIVPPEGETFIFLSFSALTKGNHSALLKMSTNDPDHSEFEFVLHAEAQACEFDFITSRDEIDFGSKKIGVSSESELYLFNFEDGPIEISSISLSPESAETEFTYSGFTGLLGASSEAINVSYTPTREGSVEAKLLIGINNNCQIYEVDLSGQGEATFWEQHQSGGIAVEVLNLEEEQSAKYIGYLKEGFLEPERVLFPIYDPYVRFPIDEEGHAFMSDLLNLEIDKLFLFDEDKKRLGSIKYSYSNEKDLQRTRHALIVLHNNLDSYGDRDNPVVEGWDYYVEDEYPVSMLIPPMNSMVRSQNKETILLVHGVSGRFEEDFTAKDEFDDVGYWGSTPRLLNNSPNHEAWQFYYPYDMAINDISGLLSEDIDLLRSINNSKINIITHSMGGLVTMNYLKTWPDKAIQNVKKTFFSVPPSFGTLSAYLFYMTGLGKDLESSANQDSQAPAFRDLSLASDFIWNLQFEDVFPDLNNSGDVADDYLVLGGVTHADFKTGLNVLLFVGKIPNESKEHHDGAVSLSSASLLSQGVPFISFAGNHDDGRSKHSHFNNDQFLPGLALDFFEKDSGDFFDSNFGDDYPEVTLVVEPDKETTFPEGTEIEDIVDSESTVYEKGIVSITLKSSTLNLLFSEMEAFYYPDLKLLAVGQEYFGTSERGINIGSFIRNSHSGGGLMDRYFYRGKSGSGEGAGLYDGITKKGIELENLIVYPFQGYTSYTRSLDFKYLQTQLVEIDLTKPDHLSDTQPPSLTSVTPSPDAQDITTTALEMTFSEPITKAYGRISVRRASDDSELFGFGAGHSRVIVVGSKVNIELPEELPKGETLYVLVPETAFRDLNGNRFAGISDKTTWRFTTDAPPGLIGTSPVDGVTEFSGTQLTMTFSKPITKAYGRISIRRASDDSELFGFGAGHSRVTVEGAKVSVELSEELPMGEALYVLVPETAFRDLNGNRFSGISDKTTWRFTTDALPGLIGTSPVDGATGFSGTQLTMTFSEPITKAYGRISIRRASDDSELFGFGAGHSRVIVEGAKVSVELSEELSPGEALYVLVPETAFRDLNGNRFSGISDKTTWRFTTDALPGLIGTSPVDGATGFSGTQLTMTFSEPITKAYGRISIRRASDDSELFGFGAGHSRVIVEGAKVSVELSEELSPGEALYVLVPETAFRDLNGNRFSGISDKTTWRFTTDALPGLIGTSPVDGATGFSGTQLTMTFSESITKAYGRISIRRASDNSELFGFGAGHSRVTVESNKVSIELPEELPGGEALYVLVPETAFRDLNGNRFAGISDKTTWRFTTDALPGLIGTSPVDGATGFSGTQLTMTFSEPITKAYGRISIRRASDNSELFGFGAGHSRVTVEGAKVSVELSEELSPGEALYVLVPETAFRDLNGNRFSGISDKTTWRFTTDALPGLIGTSPVDGATGFSGTQLTMTFSESITKAYGRISIRRASDNSELFGFGAGHSRVTVESNKVSIELPEELPGGEALYVLVPETAFRDLNGNRFAGISDKTTWRFSTGINGSNTPNMDVEYLPISAPDKMDVLKITPNPAKEEAFVTFHNEHVAGRVQLLLVDMNGVVINRLFDGEMERNEKKLIQINLRGLSEGVYLVKLLTPLALEVEKLLIQK